MTSCFGFDFHSHLGITTKGDQVDERMYIGIITTLALGLRSKQRVARLRTKRKTQESHHMLPKVQRVWENEPSHSQVNSHVGSWSPKWTFESLERDCKGQNPLLRRVIYIIGNLLKFKCLKWACIVHLDIWNTSHGQKKSHESNWQFDSQPLKVNNQPNFLACKQCVTYRWKDLDKGYNFSSNFIPIEGLHAKLCTPKVARVPVVGILGLPLRVLKQKAIWMWPLWRTTKYTIRGKVVASPKSKPWWVLCVRVARGSS